METKKEHGQFYCEVCDCELKDSANYLDHINEVKAMLQKKRMERDERLSNENKASDTTRDIPGECYEEEEDDDDEQDEGDEDVNPDDNNQE